MLAALITYNLRRHLASNRKIIHEQFWYVPEPPTLFYSHNKKQGNGVRLILLSREALKDLSDY